ncbi:MAG: hypothetical protein O7G84_04795 [Gammaproteobacteria bacterium]|nr:hypothetical protein [Gammaproteobacteria bacterium]
MSAVDPVDAKQVKAQEQRVSVIVGDRLCVQCGYNLTGQNIYREPHYDLLIARCPECGSVASVLEYPVLGRWANRWAAVIAALWVLVLLVIWLGTSGAVFGLSMATGAQGARNEFRTYIEDTYKQWEAQQAGATAPNTAPGAVNTTFATAGGTVITLPPGTPPQVTAFINRSSRYAKFTTWWSLQDKATLVQGAGGVRAVIDPRAFLMWVPLSIVAFVLGCFWGIALLRRRRLGLLIWVGVIMATAGVYALIPTLMWLWEEPSYPWSAAERIVAPPLLVLSLAYAAIPLSIGVLVGRPLARQLIRTLLPPKLRSSLSLLWTADGYDPPRV